MSEQPLAGWYADPFRRHERRYWDGQQWTDHVSSRGHQSKDAPVSTSTVAATSQTPAAWYPDPFGRHDGRFWDGAQWTEHVTSLGRPGLDPAVPRIAPAVHRPTALPAHQSAAPLVRQASKKNAKQVRRTGAGSVETGGGTLFSESVLVVNQKAKLIGSTLSYAVYNQHGQQLGTFQEVRRDLTTKLSDKVRGFGDTNRTYRFQVVDMDGQVVLAMTRPEQWFTSKSAMTIEGPGGFPIGQIAQETTGILGSAATALHAGVGSASAIAQLGLGGVRGMVVGATLSGAADRLSSATEGLKKIGHVRFGLEAGGQRLGSIHAKSTKSWDFVIEDPAGAELAAITKTWAGWTKERFTKADNYVVQMHRPLEDPLRSLVVAAALAIDVALKEGAPTSGSGRRRRYA